MLRLTVLFRFGKSGRFQDLDVASAELVLSLLGDYVYLGLRENFFVATAFVIATVRQAEDGSGKVEIYICLFNVRSAFVYDVGERGRPLYKSRHTVGVEMG